MLRKAFNFSSVPYTYAGAAICGLAGFLLAGPFSMVAFGFGGIAGGLYFAPEGSEDQSTSVPVPV